MLLCRVCGEQVDEIGENSYICQECGSIEVYIPCTHFNVEYECNNCFQCLNGDYI
ncbi:MAG: hypothetical protein LBU40_03350 [Methanobrevibacter sp.]|jgi:predicted RNA-binding Zn-ribbon protein involved in translation (DUF1610 family)|nr:hypothetical protein [Methanobrevibacter sp.]